MQLPPTEHTTTIRITASNGGTAIHTFVYMDWAERERMRRAQQLRWLRVWGALLLPLAALVALYTYGVAMNAAPPYQTGYSAAAACAQMVVLLLGGGVLWAWGERLVAWKGGQE